MSRTGKLAFLAVIVTLGLAVAACCGLELWTRYWENQWLTLKSGWETKGEDFRLASWTGGPVPDPENFARHPWLRQEDPERSATIARLDCRAIDGYAAWRDVNAPEAMPEALARRVALLDQTCAADFAALREAAARPHCRLGMQLGGGQPLSPPEFELLAHGKEALSATASAALALGDESAAAGKLALMLEIGNHLRSADGILSEVTGAGFEAAVYEFLSHHGHRFNQQSARATLRRALDLRTCPIGEDLARMMRHERAQFLDLLDRIEAGTLGNSGIEIPSVGWFRRAFIARNRLALCDDSQRFLFAPNGTITSEVQAADFDRFEESLTKRYRGKRPGGEGEPIAAGLYLATSGIGKGLLRLEDDRRQVRDALR